MNIHESLKRLIFRSWLYFRVGHGTYFAYLMGFAQWVIVVYSLYIVTSPLQSVFSHLSTFLLFFVLVYPWIAITVGFLHYKKTATFSSEVDIGLESNPYTFKIVPLSKEARLMPYSILQAESTFALLNYFKLLTPTQEKQWLEYIAMLKHLNEGKDVRDFH